MSKVDLKKAKGSKEPATITWDELSGGASSEANPVDLKFIYESNQTTLESLSSSQLKMFLVAGKLTKERLKTAATMGNGKIYLSGVQINTNSDLSNRELNFQRICCFIVNYFSKSKEEGIDTAMGMRLPMKGVADKEFVNMVSKMTAPGVAYTYKYITDDSFPYGKSVTTGFRKRFIAMCIMLDWMQFCIVNASSVTLRKFAVDNMYRDMAGSMLTNNGPKVFLIEADKKEVLAKIVGTSMIRPEWRRPLKSLINITF